MQAPANSHVSIFCRVRSPSDEEASSPIAIEVSKANHREVVVHDKYERTFPFNRCFGPDSNLVLSEVVAKPFVEDVMNGFSCYLFLYGASNAGKMDILFGKGGSEPSDALVPGFARALFSAMKGSSKESQTSVSCVQIFNEELKDVLGGAEKNSKKKLRMMDDPNRKGATIIQGLDEVVLPEDPSRIVNEILRAVAEDSEDDARRSHLIVTFTVYIITLKPSDGEEVITGKMNFVLLSGSEGLSKAGAQNRVREAPAITQSLSMFNRVVSMFAEGSKHLPCRESKLTRCVQDAFGGKGKAAFLFALSPALADIGESLSNLEFALKAKSIWTTPEVCSSFSKSALIKRYEDEVKELMQEMTRAVNKSGIYVNYENYERVKKESSEHQAKMVELHAKISELKDELASLRKACRQGLNEKKELKDRYRQATEKLNQEAEFNLKATSKAVAVKEEVKAVHNEAKLVLDSLEKGHSRLDAEAKVGQRHAYGKQKLGEMFEEALCEFRQKIELHKIQNNCAWECLNDLQAAAKNPDEFIKRKESLRIVAAELEQGFADIRRSLENKASALEAFFVCESDADVARVEFFRKAIREFLARQTRAFLAVLDQANGVVARNQKFIDAFCVTAAEFSKRMKARAELMPDLARDLEVISDEQAAEARAADASVKAIKDALEEKRKEVKEELAPRLEANFRDMQATFEANESLTKQLRQKCQLFTLEADRSEKSQKLRVDAGQKKIAEEDSGMKAAVGALQSSVAARGQEEKVELTKFDRKMNEMNDEATAFVEDGKGGVRRMDGERKARLEELKENFVSFGVAEDAARKLLTQKAAEMVEVNEEARRTALQAIGNDVADFRSGLRSAVDSSLKSAGEISDEAKAVIQQVRRLEDDFVHEINTADGALKLDFALSPAFTNLTPRHL